MAETRQPYHDNQFLILRRVRCATCFGDGLVVHPDWEMYWTKAINLYKKWRVPRMPAEKWFREHGYKTPPPEDVPCPDCNGQGYYEEYIPLIEALEALGVVKT